MSRSARDRCPISSARAVKSGISSRESTPRRTRSAASASRRIGPAMVLARNSDSTNMTTAATRNTRNSAQRSDAMILSMSPGWVDSSSAPWTLAALRIGTAIDTMVRPLASTRTIQCVCPFSASATSGSSPSPLRPSSGAVASGLPKRRLMSSQARSSGDRSAAGTARGRAPGSAMARVSTTRTPALS